MACGLHKQSAYARVHGWTLDADVLASAWLGFPPAYVVAMLLDVLVASRLAKWFAFRRAFPEGTVLAAPIEA